MKLHLPKALLTAALFAVSATTALAADIDVGIHTGGNNLASAEKNYYKHAGDLTLGTGDRMGAFKEGAFIANSGYGVEEWQATNSIGKGLTQKNFGTVAKNVQVTGTLTLTGNAQVSLGGQYKTPTDYFLAAYTNSVDEYTGIIADSIVVTDTASLTSYNATVNTLQVDAGTVNLHTSGNSKYGNTHFVVFDSKDSKQVSIREGLIINGGSTTIGHASGTYLQTAFGKLTYEGDTWVAGELMSVSKASIESSLITQTAGTLKVQGDSVSVGGLNINQTGGSMYISSGAYHDLADYGDSTIYQNGDSTTVLNVGVIRAYNSQYKTIKDKLTENGVKVELSPSINLTQEGAGTINMSGVDFTAEIGASTELSSISQSGSGTINLDGEYKGVTFDVTQTGTGTINVNGALSTNDVKVSGGNLKVNADVTANDVKVSGGYLEVNADVTANSLTQSGTGKVTVKEGKTLTVGSLEITGGEFVNYGTISGSDAQAMFAASDIATAADSTATLITVSGGEFKNFGTTENSILVDGGTLTLNEGMLADVTMTSGNIVVNSNSTTGTLTLNGGTITFEEGVTLTLTEGATLNLNNTVIEVKVSEDTLAGLLDGTTKTVTLFNTEGTTDELKNVTVNFTDGTNSAQAKVNGTADGTGVEITTTTVPEPTTATLSLLALAALAARRRRR